MEKENLQTFINEIEKFEIKVNFTAEELLSLKKQDQLINSLLLLAEKAKKQEKFKGPFLGDPMELKREDSKQNLTETKKKSTEDEDEVIPKKKK